MAFRPLVALLTRSVVLAPAYRGRRNDEGQRFESPQLHLNQRSGMAARRLYLVAAAGYPNYGDELVTSQWLRHLTKHEPDADIWVDCHNPGGAELLLGHLHPSIRFVDTLWSLGWAAPSDDPEELTAFTAQAMREPGFGEPRRAAGVELLHTVDSFHVTGGVTSPRSGHDTSRCSRPAPRCPKSEA